MELSHSNKRATKIIWNIPSSPSKTPSPQPQHTHLSLCLAPLGLDFEKVDQWKVISCYYGRVLTTGGLQDLGKQMPSGIWNRNHASYISYCLTPFYSFFFFGLFFFFLARGILVLRPGIEPTPHSGSVPLGCQGSPIHKP